MFKYLKLFRYQNLLLVAATQYVMRWCIIFPILKIYNFNLQFSEFDFALFVLATLLITAGGYVINDYFDIETDLVNRPNDVIVGKSVNRRKVVFLHIFLNTIAVFIGFYVSWKVRIWPLGIIFLLSTGLLWFYSTTYKKMFLVGNLIVAVLTALVPLMVAIYEIPLLNRAYGEFMLKNEMNFMVIFYWVLGFSFFAFLTTLTREIIKDIEDFEGDNAYGRNTLPIVIGTNYSKLIIILLSLFTLVCISLIYFTFMNDKFSLMYILLLIFVPNFLMISKVFMAQTKRDYHIASTLSKIIMFLGIGYAFVAYYMFTH